MEVGKNLKKALVAEGRSARHVTDRGDRLSAVTVRKNKLLGPGVEYCIFSDKAQTAVGVTAWVQDYEEFAGREFGRPASDARSGMVPVKLARMLVNLAGVPRAATLLDPFCGSGTIAAEALALGQRSVLASDLEERAVRQTKENVAWIQERATADVGRPSKRTLDVRVKVLRTPVEDIDRAFAGTRIDAIVTEPYLGPPLHGRESEARLARVRDELAAIYRDAFRAFARMLPPGAPVVFLFPLYKKGGVSLAETVQDDVLRAGFRLDPLIPDRFRHTPGFDLTERGIVYSRPGQRVLREIVRFRRT